MFAFIQSHMMNSSLLTRTKALLEQLENVPHEYKIAFISSDFFRVNSIHSQGLDKKSASSYLFSMGEQECFDLLKSSLRDDLTLIFNENERVFSVKSTSVEELLFKRPNVYEIQGNAISISYGTLPTPEFDLLPTEYHIHYNLTPFSCTFQEKQEEYLLSFAQRAKKDVVCLNSVYACEGNLFHGQSFGINKKAEISQRAKAFEADILLSMSYQVATPYKEKYPLIFDSLVFAIREHVRRSGLTKVVLGLSGGIDSALVAPLAVEALGKENVVGLLMPSVYSSEGSVQDAKALAENLGIKSHTIPIKDSVETFNVLVPIAEEHEVNEENSQLMLQNIQSRLRAVYLMGMANAMPAFLLATGNKSEASMGYCTLYGDTCAGLFPIGDLYKFDVYGLAKWYNQFKGSEIIPANSITKAPSAELAPGQKDSDSLPEYELLDSFLVELFEGKKDPFEIEHSFSREERISVLQKIKSAEYKRSQIAPVVRLFDVTLGKEWK